MSAIAPAALVQQASAFLHYPAAYLYVEHDAPLPDIWLEQATFRMSDQDVQIMLRHKLVAFAWTPNCTFHAAVNGSAADYGHAHDLEVAGTILPQFYRSLIRRYFSKALLNKAVHGLASSKPWASAHYRLSRGQIWVFSGIAVLASALAMFWPTHILFGLLQVIAALFFLVVVMLRCMCLLPLPKGPGVVAPPVPTTHLPIYTLLVPLFRETAVLNQLLRSLSDFEYPRDRLDIKIILEEEDRPMHQAIASIDLPEYFDIIIVPAGKPQTKPRALNYAMQFARGSLVTIYDSEDMPQPNQLRLAAAQFAAADGSLGCLQAALDFYNPNESWLTRQFAAEYAGLFHVILPALSAYGVPMALGGTSNHFRASALQAVGGWDAFNVTEDADLGIRLARHGYRCGILDSTTYEEANTQLPNWMRQRRRWLKGFLQTWLVHMRNPLLLLRQTGWAGFLAVQAQTIGVFASAMLHPILLLHALWNMLPAQLTAMQHNAWGVGFSGYSFAILLLGYVSALATNARGLRRIGIGRSASLMLTFPLYWLMITCAAWMALWDLIFAPFHWHKTQHGLSRMMAQKDHVA